MAAQGGGSGRCAPLHRGGQRRRWRGSPRPPAVRCRLPRSGIGFEEDDKPNFTGSYYSYTKVGAALVVNPVVGQGEACGWRSAHRGCAAAAADAGAPVGLSRTRLLFLHPLWFPHLPPPPVQAAVESMLREYPNVLTLRVRMPIVADLTYPRNFITKIIKYDKVGGTGRQGGRVREAW